jgi:hypothetical protein
MPICLGYASHDLGQTFEDTLNHPDLVVIRMIADETPRKVGRGDRAGANCSRLPNGL